MIPFSLLYDQKIEATIKALRNSIFNPQFSWDAPGRDKKICVVFSSGISQNENATLTILARPGASHDTSNPQSWKTGHSTPFNGPPFYWQIANKKGARLGL